MTREEAIECLNFQNEKFFGGQSEALKMAISALSENKEEWIPVSERLPDIHNYCMKYLVTDCYRHIHTSLFTETSGKGRWSHSDVIAWQHLPEPYKGGEV